MHEGGGGARAVVRPNARVVVTIAQRPNARGEGASRSRESKTRSGGEECAEECCRGPRCGARRG
eukprot:2058515-Prymnesium_polylepis.1